MSHSPPGPFFFGSVDQSRSADGDDGDDGDQKKQWQQKKHPANYFMFSSSDEEDGDEEPQTETGSESEVSSHAPR